MNAYENQDGKNHIECSRSHLQYFGGVYRNGTSGRLGPDICDAAAVRRLFYVGTHIRGSYDRHSVQKVSIAALQTASSAERRNSNGSK